MNVKLLTEHHLEFISLKGGGTGNVICATSKASDMRSLIRAFASSLSIL